ncbi:ead/Ea22-like family protein [Salmonella enterica]|nr:ead/Ea22-like family protein [Salmonella enterica]
MSNIDKQALRERYSEKPAPKCHICGSVMTIQRASAGGVVYGCTGRIDKDGEGYKFAEGRDFADDHYARSRVTVADESEPDVLALLDELEAAEKRIAELEAREISLPERSSMLHRTDFHEDYQTVMAYKVSEVIAAIRAAGIRIKGE